MFSIIIRNRNESYYLNQVLSVLYTLYSDDFDEVILVDNNSTDNSVEVGKKYKCNIVSIDDFTYGKAINLGISKAKNNYVLLLSSHVIPVGNSFFTNTLEFLNKTENVAGIRYVNSHSNYKRALENNFLIKSPLKYGLMAACCVVVKSVWEKYKFDETLPFSEDKEWSYRVVNDNYNIYDFNETFYYFIKRDQKSLLNRFKNETSASYTLGLESVPSFGRVVFNLLKSVFYKNPRIFLFNCYNDFLKTRIKLRLIKKYRKLK